MDLEAPDDVDAVKALAIKYYQEEDGGNQEPNIRFATDIWYYPWTTEGTPLPEGANTDSPTILEVEGVYPNSVFGNFLKQ